MKNRQCKLILVGLTKGKRTFPCSEDGLQASIEAAKSMSCRLNKPVEIALRFRGKHPTLSDNVGVCDRKRCTIKGWFPKTLRRYRRAWDLLEAARRESPQAVAEALHKGPNAVRDLVSTGFPEYGFSRFRLTRIEKLLTNRLRERKQREQEKYQREQEKYWQEVERKAEKRQEQNKTRWKRYLERYGYRGNEIAELLASVLRNPEDAHPEWFARAVWALEMNRATGGNIWTQYQETGELTYDDIRVAIRAAKRHDETDYDELLRKGVDRETARLLMLPRGKR